MGAKIQVVFYSMYGHVYKMAEAVAEGAGSVPGVEVVLRQVPETLSDEALAKMGATEARKAFAHVPVADADGLRSGCSGNRHPGVSTWQQQNASRPRGAFFVSGRCSLDRVSPPRWIRDVVRG